MSSELNGKKIAFLVAQEGIEEVELTEPWKAVREAGGSPVLVAPQEGEVQSYNHLDKSATYPVDQTLDQARAQDFDGVVLPGGVANPDQLRTEDALLSCVQKWRDQPQRCPGQPQCRSQLSSAQLAFGRD